MLDITKQDRKSLLREHNITTVQLSEFLSEYSISIFGLQEHMRRTDSWPISIKGFNCFSSFYNPYVQGSRGVALLVANHLPAIPSFIADWFVGVKVIMNSWSILFISVYIPCNIRISDKKKIYELLNSEIAKSRCDKVVCLGDFNDPLMNKLESFVSKLSPKFIINGFTDNAISYFQLDTPKSALDKFLVTESLASFISSSRVNNESLLVSDHRAIQSEILLPHSQPVPSASSTRRKINRSKMESKRLDNVNQIAFSELPAQINDLASEFLISASPVAVLRSV
jgi:hypothetical protein